MSKKETQNTDQTPEKVMTKYDLKMQRRKEEKAREVKSRYRGNLFGVLMVVALVCFVAYFPIRNYLTVHGTYIKVNGENISRVEYDYNYNVAKNSYLTQNAYYLYMMGMDPSQDISSQMYSDTLTWGDYFGQLAVEQIVRNKTLYKQAKEEGFSYDVAGEYGKYKEALASAASESGTTAGNYLKQLYGVYATQGRVKPMMEESLYAAAYYDELAERNKPSMEEIQTYYGENKASYDSVDYYLLTVDAELPTEPTELADPVEETEGEGTETQDQTADGTGTEKAYQPSEAEIEFAMKEARQKADKSEAAVKTEGDFHENTRRSSVPYKVQDWLFDEARKAGDSTVIEDTTGNRYYVVEFKDRYLDETPTVDVRMVMTKQDNGQAILDEWKGGAATEESFAELCDKYNDSSATPVQGGLLEAMSSSAMPDEISSWTHSAERKAGDTTVISPESEENTYVLYYVGANEAEWILSIRDTLLGKTMSEYVDAFIKSAQVEDPKNHLRYLQVKAEESASAESAEAESGAESSDGTETQGSTESGEDAASESSGEESSAQ